MPFHKRPGLWMFLPMLCTVVLSAQQTTPPMAAASSIDLDVVVTHKTGPPVADLEQQDFTVLVNKKPQPVTSFRAVAGSEAAVKVIVVIDAVNIPYQRLAYARGEIEKFLRANGGHLAAPVALAFYTDNGVQLQKTFSSDGNELGAYLENYSIGLRDIRRTSQFQESDRFQLSVDVLSSLVGSLSHLAGRKLILWVSPGWPLLSGPSIYLDNTQEEQLFGSVVRFSTLLRQAQTTLYAIDPIGAAESVLRTFYYEDFLKGISKVGDVQVADLSLQVLATQSGGIVFNGNNNVAGMLQQCVADAAAYYELSFTPPPAKGPNQYHSIEIELSKPGLTARTRGGYYANPGPVAGR